MEPLIQKIIAQDLAARKKVAAVSEEKKNVKKAVEAQKEAIFAAKQQEAEARIASLKQKNEEELAKAKAQKTLEYETASNRLRIMFAEKKEDWISDLVQRCIHG